MATQQNLTVVTLAAVGSISKYHCCEAYPSADLSAKQCDADTDNIIGIAQNDAASGDPVGIAVYGLVKVKCTDAAGITGGTIVAPNSDGGVKPAQAGDKGIGVALNGMNLNAIGEILFVPNVFGVNIAGN